MGTGAKSHAREGGDALPYKLPITSEKPPGTSPGGLRYLTANAKTRIVCGDTPPGTG